MIIRDRKDVDRFLGLVFVKIHPPEILMVFMVIVMTVLGLVLAMVIVMMMMMTTRRRSC